LATAECGTIRLALLALYSNRRSDATAVKIESDARLDQLCQPSDYGALFHSERLPRNAR
jgi:hypothetical protein